MQKFSIYAGVATKYPFEERMAAIAAAGYDAVCLDFERDMEGTEGTWESQMKLAQRYALPVENVHLTGAGMNAVWSEGEEGEYMKNRLIDELCEMGRLGVKIGVAHVTWGLNRPEANFEVGLRRYREAVEAAEKYGVQLALENSVFPEYVHFLFEHIQSPHLGFCYDSGHENAFTPTENYLEKYGDILIAMHLHDNDGKRDLHTMPLHGTIDWKKKVGQLKRCRLFHEMITLECSVFPGSNAEESFRGTLEEARKLLLL